jgi:hypothetical protein
MTPEQAIDSLDRMLAKVGQSVTLQKLVSGVVTVQGSCRAFVRGYRPEEFIGGITQNDMKMIFSPTDATKGAWGALPSIVPVRGDRVVLENPKRVLAVQAAIGIQMNDKIVRLEAQIRG